MPIDDGGRSTGAVGMFKPLTLIFAGYGISMLAQKIADELVHRGVAALLPAVNSPAHPFLYMFAGYLPFTAWIVGALWVGTQVRAHGWAYGVAGALIRQLVNIEALVKDARSFAFLLTPVPAGEIVVNPWSFGQYALFALQVVSVLLVTCAAAALGGWLGERSARKRERSGGGGSTE